MSQPKRDSHGRQIAKCSIAPWEIADQNSVLQIANRVGASLDSKGKKYKALASEIGIPNTAASAAKHA